MEIALVNNIDYGQLEERMAAILVGMSEEEVKGWRELLGYCNSDTTSTRFEDKCRSGMSIKGNSYDVIIQDDIVEVQPKKKPVPFYQTLNKQHKFVRK